METLLQELYIDWNELEAYRNLQGKPFDFGTGLITDDSSQSEDAYYEIEQWSVKMTIDDIKNKLFMKNLIKQKRKYKSNNYNNKYIKKDKLKKLSKYVYTIYYNKDKKRYKQFYLSGCKSYAKWCTNKQVRNRNDFPNNPSGYRKTFDYWWTVF